MSCTPSTWGGGLRVMLNNRLRGIDSIRTQLWADEVFWLFGSMIQTYRQDGYFYFFNPINTVCLS